MGVRERKGERWAKQQEERTKKGRWKDKSMRL